MQLDEAIRKTQDRLTAEGGTMGDLLSNFRKNISPVLIGDEQWELIVERARMFPAKVGALPFGFELPLHERRPMADFGVSLESGTAAEALFLNRSCGDETDDTAKAVQRLFGQMNTEHSALREIVGRKIMLEYDIGSAPEGEHPHPGVFMRPGERPIIGAGGQISDVSVVADALVSCVGWERNEVQSQTLRDTYLAQPAHTRLDAFGIFPSRSRNIRLAVMGFKSRRDIRSFLERARWPGDFSSVDSLLSRFMEHVKVVGIGVYLDVAEDCLSAEIGLTLIVRQRYTKEKRYWLDGMTDWDPLLNALGHEELVAQEKIAELANWVSKPTTLFAKSGQFVLLRGIHHIKLVMSENQLKKIKAYVFFVLSGAISF